MRKVFSLVERVGDTDTTLMINGETGTGKGLIARAIHKKSNRSDKPFVQINCGAIPENLLESELFGHLKGAFTGATAPKKGKFEMADGGTLFLDEIGDMSLDLQVKLLRALEEKEFEPVGGCRTIKVDVRVIAATHRDLKTKVKEGTFRKDLYYRLYVIPIDLPPLRDRKSDIPLMVPYFIEMVNREQHRNVTGFSRNAIHMLMDHDWEGNVRELKNVMERMVVLKASGEVVCADLPEEFQSSATTSEIPNIDISDGGICLNSAVTEFERNLIYQSLEQSNWVKKKAAQLLQLKRTTLVEKIKRYELQKQAS